MTQYMIIAIIMGFNLGLEFVSQGNEIIFLLGLEGTYLDLFLTIDSAIFTDSLFSAPSLH